MLYCMYVAICYQCNIYCINIKYVKSPSKPVLTTRGSYLTSYTSSNMQRYLIEIFQIRYNVNSALNAPLPHIKWLHNYVMCRIIWPWLVGEFGLPPVTKSALSIKAMYLIHRCPINLGRQRRQLTGFVFYLIPTHQWIRSLVLDR